MSTNKFGGQWTDTKLVALSEYLSAYTKALKGQPFSLHYIDTFAGAGAYIGKTGEEKAGSASIALSFDGFSSFTFVEKKRSFVKKLEVLKGQFPGKVVNVHHGDANERLRDISLRFDRKANRAVLFLDPFGMHVHWSTLEVIRATGAIDVWYLVPLNGILRQMALDPTKRDADKDLALDRILGTTCWREELYKPPLTLDMFQPDKLVREGDPAAVCDWLTARLQTLFPLVINVATLTRGTDRSATAGPRLFALYFLMANDAPKALGLAHKLVNGVRTKLVRDALVT